MTEIYGNIAGIKRVMLEKMQALSDYGSPGEIISKALCDKLAEFTYEINREIAVYLNKQGKVINISLGDDSTVQLPDIAGRKSNRIICIHTHPNGNGEFSENDIAALKKIGFDIMIVLGVGDKTVSSVSVGYLDGFDNQKNEYRVAILGPFSPQQFYSINLKDIVTSVDKCLIAKEVPLSSPEKVLLVGLDTDSDVSISDSLQELERLAETAGAEIVGLNWQRKKHFDAALFVGRGKAEEIMLQCQQLDVSTVIFDDELTPVQQRNLENLLGVKVIDRTALILDIFAQHAHSYEGKLQVELAQLKYHLPRIVGKGLSLSRLGGGIGTRGPGETKLEVDRRRLRQRIHDIEKQIQDIQKHRMLHRVKRQQEQIATVALVGYTNAGKSTLMNSITNAGVLTADKLFATLDPTIRKFTMPSGGQALLVDTVGFIRKLPHQLIAAFKATLEEVVHADILIHVVDASSDNYESNSQAVFSVLKEIHAENKPLITVFNKIDRIDNSNVLERLLRLEQSVAVSASTGYGVDNLLAIIENTLEQQRCMVDVTMFIPYSQGACISEFYKNGHVDLIRYEEKGIYLEASLTKQYVSRYKHLVIARR